MEDCSYPRGFKGGTWEKAFQVYERGGISTKTEHFSRDNKGNLIKTLITVSRKPHFISLPKPKEKICQKHI
jgi:hypothetical protein